MDSIILLLIDCWPFNNNFFEPNQPAFDAMPVVIGGILLLFFILHFTKLHRLKNYEGDSIYQTQNVIGQYNGCGEQVIPLNGTNSWKSRLIVYVLVLFLIITPMTQLLFASRSLLGF